MLALSDCVMREGCDKLFPVSSAVWVTTGKLVHWRGILSRCVPRVHSIMSLTDAYMHLWDEAD